LSNDAVSSKKEVFIVNAGIYNLISLFLGLVSWAIPAAQMALVKHKKGLGRFVPVLSMGACCLAIWFQICYDEHLVNIEDWSALMDTIAGVRRVSLFLLVTTCLLNLALACAERKILESLPNEEE